MFKRGFDDELAVIFAAQRRAERAAGNRQAPMARPRVRLRYYAEAAAWVAVLAPCAWAGLVIAGSL